MRENCMMMSFVMCIYCKYDFGDQTKKDKMSKGVTCVGERNVYRVWVGEPEEKRRLVRPRHRGEDNTKLDLTEVGWEGMGGINLAQDMEQWRAVEDTILYLWAA